MKVKVYYNLHKNCFSVVSLERGENYGRVIAHCDQIVLKNVQFKVSEAGRQRVLREQKKNVHAYAIGHIYTGELPILRSYSVTYNPYKYSSFMMNLGDNNLTSVYYASYAKLDNKQIFVLM